MSREDLRVNRKLLTERFPTWERLTLYQRFAKTAQEFSQHEFICTEDRTYTYAQALAEVDRIAKGFMALGVKRRDHVAISLGNYPEFIFITFALSKIGAVKIPVNCKLCNDGLDYVLAQSECKLFVAMDDYSGKSFVDDIMPEVCPQMKCGAASLHHPKLEKIIMFPGNSCVPCETLMPWQQLLDAGASVSDAELAARQSLSGYPDEVADLFYTSGTTGRPKGAMLTHDMLLRSAYSSALNRGFKIGRRILVPIPFFHVYAYVEGLLTSILVGGTLVIQDHSSTELTLKLIEKYKAEDILSVPAIMLKILDSPKRAAYDLSSLQAVYCSASATPAWVWQKIRDELQVDDIITGYGMTEVCGASMQTEPYDGNDILLTKVGKLLPGGASGLPEFGGCQIQYKVVDHETGEELPYGSVGELYCRGNVVIRGYYKEPQITAETFDKDGWMATGDLGRFDEHGYLELTGRCKDMYKTGGENVSPKTVEVAIEENEKVKQAVAVGIPDNKMGEVGVAFIELKEGAQATEEEMRQYCLGRLSRYEVPQYYVFMTKKEWPLTATQKIQKFHLKEIAQEKFIRKN